MRPRLALAIVLLIPFLVLTIAILSAVAVPFDIAALQAASRLRDDRIVTVARLVSRLGEPIAVAIITGCTTVGMIVTQRIRDAVFVVASVVGAALVDGVAKWMIARPRPLDPAPAYDATYFAFPSGHSMVCAAMFFAIFIVLRDVTTTPQQIGIAAAFIGIVLTVGATRVLLGVHYPSDVLGGFLLGVALVLAFDVARIWGRPA